MLAVVDTRLSFVEALVTVHDQDRGKRAERARAVGLFRYALVRAAADPQLSAWERGALVRDLAAAEHAGPFGQPVRVSQATLDRWIRAWRTGGFDALVPDARRVAPRTEAQVLDLAAALKREKPAADRCAGASGGGGASGLGAVGAYAAAAVRAAGAQHPPGRAGAAGVRPVRRRPPE